METGWRSWIWERESGGGWDQLSSFWGGSARLCQGVLGVQTLAEASFDVPSSSSPFFPLHPSSVPPPPPLSHVNALPMHKRAKQSLIDSNAGRHTRTEHTTAAPANHLGAGSRSRKAQSESCWREAAAPHLRGEVSVNTMCLSASSGLTSVLIVTPPPPPSLSSSLPSSALTGILLLLLLLLLAPGCRHGPGVMMFPS